MTDLTPAEVVLACSRPVTRDEEAARLAEQAAAIDWTATAGLAHHHGVAVLVARRLHELGVEPPPAARAYLARLERDTLLSGTIHAAETRRLVALLDDAGVRALPLKGPTLTATAYGDLGARRSGDLDVLVRPADLDATEAALLAGGYRYETEPCTDARRRWHRRVEGQLPPMRRDDNVVKLEVHCTVHKPVFRMPMDEDGMRARARPLGLGPLGAVRAMAPEDMLLVVCTHAGRSNWVRFEWAACLARLCGVPGLDWELVEDLARRAGVRRLLALGLLYAAQVEDALPAAARRLSDDPAARRLEPRMAPLLRPWSAAEEAAEPVSDGLEPGMLRYWFARRERRRDQLAVVAWMLTPKGDDAHHVGLPRALEFLVWPRRWLRVLLLTARALRG